MSKYLISLILLSVISMGVSAQRITRQYNNGKRLRVYTLHNSKKSSNS